MHAGAETGSVSFVKDVRPILSENCFKCHGPDANTRAAGLRLDTAEGAAEVLSDNRANSELYARITATNPDDQMPPPDSGHELTPDQVETLGRWIDAGGQYEKHWAFVSPVRPDVPAVDQTDWPKTDIDRFILAKLEENGIAPSPQTDKRTLLRRTHLDLTGLPPTPEEQEAFLNDDSPFAYEKRVDALLASPRFGEKWARHWLDAARYADSNGYSIDSPRSIWPYRDWVIDAFNDDKPFDAFVVEQMAGDLLPEATRDQKVATGFHRNTMIKEEGGIDKEEFRMEAVADRVNTVGTVFLGLTMSCARCHDHKYDPVSQTEYFRLFAFLNNDDETTLSLPTPEQQEEIRAARAEERELRAALEAYITDHADERQTWEDGYPLKDLRDLEAADRAALLTAPDKRNDDQKSRVLELYKREDRELRHMANRLKILERVGDDVPTTMVVVARSEPRETHRLNMGDYTQPAEVVTPGAVEVLNPLPTSHDGTRLDLAKWLVDPANPLLARVTVNRFWQRLYGKGLVETENDFGSQGTLPTHPELLDWLAVEFVDSGWQVKALLKQMVMSATYRQASRPRPDLQEVDPTNMLLARQNRLRLEAEIIRDAALTAAGVLDDSIGGAPVYPPQPEGVTSLGQRNRKWDTSDGDNRFRRGIYTAFWRSTPYYGLTVFDAPNAQAACTRRVRSNTPLQALTLLNDPAYVELAQELGARLLDAEAGSPEARIANAFTLCLARTPSDQEVALLTDLYHRQRETFAATPDRAVAAFGVESEQAVEGAAWTMVARAMLNLDEFVTRE
jgi:hypothetical protein